MRAEELRSNSDPSSLNMDPNGITVCGYSDEPLINSVNMDYEPPILLIAYLLNPPFDNQYPSDSVTAKY